MTLESIDIPSSALKNIDHSESAVELIDEANDRIEAFMLADQVVIENFVTCDFHLVDQALHWIQENRLLTGDQFCELGSGFGVVTMLAAMRGMPSIGIEIESTLVEQSAQLADDLGIAADFYSGSFVPRDVDQVFDQIPDIEHVETSEGDVYREIGQGLSDFDLFFAFPWPGEHEFFEAVLDQYAAVGSMLLTYRGREGMHLVRKVSDR